MKLYLPQLLSRCEGGFKYLEENIEVQSECVKLYLPQLLPRGEGDCARFLSLKLVSIIKTQNTVR